MPGQQEALQRFGQLQQQSKQLQEQLEQINQQIQEFEDLKRSIDNIKNSKNKEMLAPVGKGVFFKSELKDNKLFVGVGSNIVVRREPSKAKDIVEKQIKRMEEVKEDLTSEIEKINGQFQDMMSELQKGQN